MSVDDVIGMLNDMKKDMARNKQDMEERLERLEEGKEQKPGDWDSKGGEKTIDSQSGSGLNMQTAHMAVTAGRERPLTRTFGTDTSANALMEFLDHYTLCVDINVQKGIPGWDRPDYRAKELRCQLTGEAATMIRQEEAMLEPWVNDDREIIKKLKDRWVNRDCIELDIIEFEEARQSDNESLAQFMTRVKGLGQRAFSEFDPRGMQQRIIWRFLDGVRDRDVRASIIRERWMVDRVKPKSYDEVLKIGENALMVKVAAQATGSLGSAKTSSNSGGSNKNPIHVATVRTSNSKRGKGVHPGEAHTLMGVPVGDQELPELLIAFSVVRDIQGAGKCVKRGSKRTPLGHPATKV